MLSTRRATTSPTTSSAGASSCALADERGDGPDRSDDDLRIGHRRLRHDRRRRLRRPPARHERRARLFEPAESHVEDERPFARDVRREIELAGVRVRRHERHAGRALAVRERDGRRRRRAQRRGDAGDHLEGNARGRELLGLFSAASEDERIAALEADDVLALEGPLDDERMDARLVVPAAAGPPPDRDELRVARSQREDARGHELVVGDDRGVREEPVRPRP